MCICLYLCNYFVYLGRRDKALNKSGQGYKIIFLQPSSNTWNKFCFQYKSWKSILWAVNSTHFFRGGCQLKTSFSQWFLLQFPFWMGLKVNMAIFPRNGVILDTLYGQRQNYSIFWKCIYNWHFSQFWKKFKALGKKFFFQFF